MSKNHDSAPLRRIGLLAFIAAAYTYALIVFGGIVRITGSGMGCGDEWPKCNGRWIPTFTLETFIEYMHRLLAAGIGAVLLGVFLYAVVHRGKPGFGGRGGVLRPLGLGAVLLVAQALLGAVTVWLELPTGVTVAHFLTAQIFIATLLVAAVRGGFFGRVRPVGAPGGPASAAAAGGAARKALITAVFGFVVLAFGALTANTPGAPAACQGFPLCNGSVLPSVQAASVHIHWTHRTLAFLFLFHTIGMVIGTAKRGGGRAAVRAAVVTLALVVLQFAVAATLVLTMLPRSLQALHLAVGVAIWFALVVWTALARRDAAGVRAADPVRAVQPPVPALG